MTAPPSSFLQHITPVILTYNESANIGRCLANLTWAKDIVVVDSFSTDDTAALCAAHPRVRFFQRAFDSHARQWTYAIQETGIGSPWVLALDCDYMAPAKAVAELDRLSVDTPLNGFWISFRYAIAGKVLRCGIYPPVLALYRLAAAHYIQDGHTQRVVVDGVAGRLAEPFVHDDRKSLDHWLRSQIRYAGLEAEKLRMAAPGWSGWLRTRTPFAPLVMAIYCLIIRGALFEGPAGWTYAAERTVAEAMIAVCFWFGRLEPKPKSVR